MKDLPDIPDATLDRAMQLLEVDSLDGICLNCGFEPYGVEPDTRRRICEGCKKPTVFGAEEIVLMGGIRG